MRCRVVDVVLRADGSNPGSDSDRDGYFERLLADAHKSQVAQRVLARSTKGK